MQVEQIEKFIFLIHAMLLLQQRKQNASKSEQVMIDNCANHIKLDNRLAIKINVPCFCLYFVIMQIYNRHEGTRRARQE